MSIRGVAKLVAAAAAWVAANGAMAAVVVVDFEDKSGTGVLLEDGYKGIIWGGKFLTYDTAAPPFTPTSGTTAAYFNYETGGMTAGNGYTQSLFFQTDVLFEGVYFAGDSRTVTLGFYRDGVLLGERSANTSAVPTYFQGITQAVDEIRINGGAGNFVFDDLTYNTDILAAVPEPATWAMMIAGFGMAGAAVRRSHGKVAALA